MSKRTTLIAFSRFKNLLKSFLKEDESKLFTNKSYVKLQEFSEKMVLQVLTLVVAGLGKRKTVTEADIEAVCRVLNAGHFEVNLGNSVGVFPKRMGHHFVAKVEGSYRMSKSASNGVGRLYFACMTKLSRGVLAKSKEVDASMKKIKNEFVSETCGGMMLS